MVDQIQYEGFPDGSGANSPPSNAGDMGSISLICSSHEASSIKRGHGRAKINSKFFFKCHYREH